MSKNLSKLSGRKGIEENLFDRTGKLAEPAGTPHKKDLEKVAREFAMGPANTYGTASFYDFTKPENEGKKVYLCNGTSCLLAGTQGNTKAALLQHFKEEEIGEMTCLGRCHENGAFQYGGHNFSGHSIDGVASIFQKQQLNGQDVYSVEALSARILTRPFPQLSQSKEIIGKFLAKKPEATLKEIKRSGLRSRGGAGFPNGLKLEMCARAEGHTKFIVCNADEGDPGSFSDRFLLEQRPYSVLLGMLIAGYAVGAQYGILYIRKEYPDALRIVSRAVQALEEAQLAGERILDTDFAFQFKIIEARGSYVCGEETALLASIEGQRPEMRVRPPYPVEAGLFNQPTLVNNVETLANIFHIMEMGGEAYAKLGTQKSTGTKLLSLDSAFNAPGVYEVEMGTPMKTVIDQLGKGFSKPVKALHVGGPLGGMVPLSKVSELELDFESFAQHGFLLGHASIIGIPEDFSMVEYLEHLFAFAAHESCGKCFPCRLGSIRGKELLQKAKRKDIRISTELFSDLLETLEKGSLCGLGSGVPKPVRNALTYFKDELSYYFEDELEAFFQQEISKVAIHL